MTVQHALLEVPAISCSHCKAAIERAVGAVDGVKDVAVDVAGRTVAVDFDAGIVTLGVIEAAIADEGYEVAGRQVGAA